MAEACDSVAVPGDDVAPPTSSLSQCKPTINPHMRGIVDRHQTFTEYCPSDKIEADTTLQADAGFYYLGEGDQVKCWYCNGSLKNWDRFDAPWIEHVRWFPLCEYLLKNNGVDFFIDIVKGFIGLKRPAVPNPPPENKLQGLLKLVKNKTSAKTATSVPTLCRP